MSDYESVISKPKESNVGLIIGVFFVVLFIISILVFVGYIVYKNESNDESEALILKANAEAATAANILRVNEEAEAKILKLKAEKDALETAQANMALSQSDTAAAEAANILKAKEEAEAEISKLKAEKDALETAQANMALSQSDTNMGTGTTSAPSHNIPCTNPRIPIDMGYPDTFRGWYDTTNCGTANTYCRWVGNSGSGGDPKIKTQHESSWWACTQPDNDLYPNTNEVWPGTFNFTKQVYTTGDCEKSKDPIDVGYDDGFRGWYDTNRCNYNNTYCRWVGGSGSGGNPKDKTVHEQSFWTCTTPTADLDPSTLNGPKSEKQKWTDKFEYTKQINTSGSCAKSSAPTGLDVGYDDSFRGWYDTDRCNQGNRYCRWVGNSGSGGDPKLKTDHGESWWSCMHPEGTNDSKWTGPFNFTKS